MASGTITFGASGVLQGKIEWSSASNGSSANSSNATAILYGRRTDSYGPTSGKSWSGNVTLDGTAVAINFSNSVSVGSGWVEMARVSKTIAHNNDGSKQVTISGSVTGPSGTSLASKTSSGSQTVTLDKIPRKSTITASDGIIGSTTTININRATSTFTHTLTYSFSSTTGTIVTKTTSDSYTWTIPTSFYAQIPNAKKGTCTITCETFDGNTSLGTNTATFKASINETSSKPTITATIIDANSTTVALTGSNTKLVRYISNAKVTLTATAKNSATITQKRVNGNVSSSNEYTINNVENNSFTVDCTDSRGLVASQTYTKASADWIDYVKLAFTDIKLTRLSSTSTTFNADIKGNYYNASIGNTANTLTFRYRYREVGGSYSGYTTLTATKTGNTFTYNANLGIAFATDKEYEIEFNAVDKLMNVVNKDGNPIKLNKAVPMIDIYKNNIKVSGDLYSNNFGFPTNGRAKWNGNTILRNNGTSTILSANTSSIYLKPNGDATSTNQAQIDTNGVLTLKGSTANIVYSGKSLYDNASGTTGTVTLSETSANFTYIDIFAKSRTGVISCVRIYNPNGQKALLMVDGEGLNTYGIFNKVWLKINGTSITKDRENVIQLQNGVLPNIDTSTSYYTLSIVRVDGYR